MCNIHQNMTHPESGVRHVSKSLTGKVSSPLEKKIQTNKRVIYIPHPDLAPILCFKNIFH